jgi:hypothetical protein
MTETTTTAAKTTRTRKPRAAKPAPPITPPAPPVAPQPVASEEQPKAKTPTDYRKEIDLAIITAAGALVAERVPEEMRPVVARLIANQLHHLSTPKTGWPTDHLPKPERSDWR